MLIEEYAKRAIEKRQERGLDQLQNGGFGLNMEMGNRREKEIKKEERSSGGGRGN